MDSYVVLDLETTGLSVKRDGIIEIAAIKVSDGVIVDEFSTFVNPGIPISPATVDITGITDDMLSDAPSVTTALESLIDFIGSCPLIGHNIKRFDLKFIQRDAEKYLGHTITNEYVDTLYLSNYKLPQLEHHSLQALALYYGISYEGAHRALADCRINHLVYEKLRLEKKPSNNDTDSGRICPKCGSELVERSGKFGKFMGCAGYPVCKYTEKC